MAAVSGKQDMPPVGGYKAIPYKKIPARQYFSGTTLIAGYLGITAGAAYLYYLNRVQVHREDLERRSGRLAIHPLLLAERDRNYLKQLRRNRDAERELMKDVEGWKVGTYYGEPIYESKPDAFVEPSYPEFYVHTDIWAQLKRTYFIFFS
ncbi:NADH dehydrogenase [ubiquinone] 1 alpha subcomplex subunit 13 [Coccinella septempunctata]|uniref:NADH dehydrogenase [ubiquinone] 1 alpha subcomplex subunit 13 n=1 Tax=Coccinella septempunctata TaxID=41139 RepID=UPI001D07C23F|nr:NADH dehydrogenase [ubiquinone] 1 alpha subcomplex subunit 13 [Coccinella septempunctata]